MNFKREYLGKWVDNIGYYEAYKLWLEYHYNCALFDSKVCTGFNEYEEHMPANQVEFGLLYRNARRQMQNIEFKRKCLINEGVAISDTDWQSAKEDVARYTYDFDELQKEYNRCCKKFK
jgi:hypothetical protein